MKTIKERARILGLTYARQYYKNSHSINNNFICSNEEITDACIEMAKDQLQIDIERAWEFISKYCAFIHPSKNEEMLINKGVFNDFMKGN